MSEPAGGVRWTRAHQPVTKVGAWWGPALHALRRTGERSTEEIDVVGLARNQVTLIGEARWRNKPMDVGYLDTIDTYKQVGGLLGPAEGGQVAGQRAAGPGERR